MRTVRDLDCGCCPGLQRNRVLHNLDFEVLFVMLCSAARVEVRDPFESEDAWLRFCDSKTLPRLGANQKTSCIAILEYIVIVIVRFSR
jgi:hypothetical protein